MPQPPQDGAGGRFLKACRREPTDCTPIWIMRQAGRYLPEYRELRLRHSLLHICRTPELALEVAMQPIRRFDLDAAILFSDLLIPIAALGVEFDIIENRGPVLPRPVRDASAVKGLRVPSDLETLAHVFETIGLIKSALKGRIPVIGFAGAPFTLASYLIEGGASRDFSQTKLLMYREPAVWADLLSRLADLVIAYVQRQVRAGADAVQIFDSWAGCLSPADYRRFVLEPTRRIFTAGRASGVPMIHFATNSATLLDLMAEAGGDVLSVDWRIPLSQVRSRHPGRAVQGNLDPLALMAPEEVLDRMIEEVLTEAGTEPGHVFNLGHGILPQVSPDAVRRLVDTVHRRTKKLSH